MNVSHFVIHPVQSTDEGKDAGCETEKTPKNQQSHLQVAYAYDDDLTGVIDRTWAVRNRYYVTFKLPLRSLVVYCANMSG